MLFMAVYILRLFLVWCTKMWIKADLFVIHSMQICFESLFCYNLGFWFTIKLHSSKNTALPLGV